MERHPSTEMARAEMHVAEKFPSHGAAYSGHFGLEGLARCSRGHGGVARMPAAIPGTCAALMYKHGAQRVDGTHRLGDVRWTSQKEYAVARSQLRIRKNMRNGGADVSLDVFLA